MTGKHSEELFAKKAITSIVSALVEELRRTSKNYSDTQKFIKDYLPADVQVSNIAAQLVIRGVVKMLLEVNQKYNEERDSNS